MFTLPRLRDTQAQFYSPAISSPLSSSPLRNSPSPLSPRDTNVPTRDFDAIMSSPIKATKTANTMRIFDENLTTPIQPTFNKSQSQSALPSPPPSRSSAARSAFSKRPTKANPLIHGRGSAEEGRETRRKLFLKGVREKSEEKRWEGRGGDDEIMRCIWVTEQRRLEERRRREAAMVGEEVMDEDLEGVMSDEAMVDEVALKEEEELEALLGSYLSSQDVDQSMVMSQGEGMWHNQNQDQCLDTPYGSDDDEYDDIFMDVIQEENPSSSQQQQQPSRQDHDQDMMDMS